MKYIKLFENYNTSILQNLKNKEYKDFNEFMEDIHSSKEDKLKELFEYIQNFNNSLKGIKLYHGTTDKKAKIIEKNGFRLTKGIRGFIMGANEEVDNLGVFLSDNKSTANFFGENRADNGYYKVLDCVCDVSNTLDFNGKIPYKIHKLGSDLLNEYDGGKRSKISKNSVWWCLDQTKFVDLIKSEGYDSVKFYENPYKDKSQSHTYFIMDSSKIQLVLKTYYQLYSYFCK